MYLILILCITFSYKVICVNNNVCGSLCVTYKYKGNVFFLFDKGNVLIPLSWEI